ncbi:MAG: hypothetical protein CBC22_03680 [Alphaproteobacteria bacterium TMED62]|nr:MAG: hypothetical protein CBC22_03680 [Alphaproteobacteria bacterium TMED62]|tara:strand:- start:13161 stop:13610 length:450 start_codon:yes stop_codon:yes gene_type:complete
MSEIKIRKLNRRDIFLLYCWFNDKENLQFKIKTKYKILFRNHKVWLLNFIKNKTGFIWIIKYKNKDVGNIRLNKLFYKTYEIDIFIMKEFRSLKIASKSLIKVENNLKKGSVIHSYVKKNNLRSYKFFIKNNFSLFNTNKEVWFLKKHV